MHRRRRQERYPCELAAICCPVTRGEAAGWEGEVVDISRGGVRIALPRPFEPGAILHVRVSRRTGGFATPPLLEPEGLRRYNRCALIGGECGRLHPITVSGGEK